MSAGYDDGRLVGAPKRRFATWDIESKAGDSQQPGFTRPFLVGLYARFGRRFRGCFTLELGATGEQLGDHEVEL